MGSEVEREQARPDNIRNFGKEGADMNKLIYISLLFSVIALVTSITLYLKLKNMEKLANFETVNAQRINIVEPDGRKRLLIFDSAQMPGPVIEGHQYSPLLRGGSGNAAGLIFLNDDESEMGGLLWTGKKTGDKYFQEFYFSIDPYLQNELVSFVVSDQNGEREVRFTLFDRPFDPEGFKNLIRRYDQYVKVKDENPEKAKEIEKQVNDYIKKFLANHTWEPQRFVMFKRQDGSAGIKLFDKEGKRKVEVGVDSAGAPAVKFYDEKGKVVKEIRE